jgi:hypothetical protein
VGNAIYHSGQYLAIYGLPVDEEDSDDGAYCLSPFENTNSPPSRGSCTVITVSLMSRSSPTIAKRIVHSPGVRTDIVLFRYR